MGFRIYICGQLRKSGGELLGTKSAQNLDLEKCPQPLKAGICYINIALKSHAPSCFLSIKGIDACLQGVLWHE